MGHEEVTLGRYLLTSPNSRIPATDLALIMERLAIAGKTIAQKLACSSLSGGHGYSGERNVQGEQQKKLDEWTNDTFLRLFTQGFPVCSVVSEEMEKPKHYVSNCRGHQGDSYAVLLDPLDGSSNTDVDGSLGTIFSLRKRAARHGDGAGDLLTPGIDQVAAGYIVYGPATEFVYTAGAGVNIFSLDPKLGEFVLWRENAHMPGHGSMYAVNQGNIGKWHPGAQRLVQHMTSRKDKRTSYSLRYCGALVADFHRFLLEGGIYLYPSEITAEGKSKPKLRLMYELAPLALIAEAAGGRASNGKQRILDIKPQEVHQREAVYIGSAEEVALAEEFRAES